MYNNSNYPPPDFQKYSDTEPIAVPTGIPVGSGTGQHYPSGPPPPGIQLQQRSEVPWSTGLCDCFSDVPNCCITCWCPCITFGQVSEIVDKGSSSCVANGALYTLIALVTGCACCYSCFYRSKMRQQYLLREDPCGDCLVHCCCQTCALCQEYRELQNRGFDMSIGWLGNEQRQTRGVAMTPIGTGAPTMGGMTR